MKEKKVSIVVPAYNVENYIDECMESILAQTYQNIEVIVVNDGSTDDTLNHLSKFEAASEKVKVLTKNNSGVSASRNLGIDEASGEYVCFVDGDDYIEADHIKYLVEKMETGVDWVGCQYRRFDDQNQHFLESYRFDVGDFSLKSIDEKLDFAFNRLLIYQVGYEVWNKLYRMDIIKNNNIKFDTLSKIGEDLSFNICYLSVATQIISTSVDSYIYRVRDGSAMNKRNPQNDLKEYLHFLQSAAPFWGDEYIIIFARTIENAKRNMTDIDIARYIVEFEKNGENMDFAKAMIKKLAHGRCILSKWYGNIGGKVVTRHYLYVAKELGIITQIDRIRVYVYSLYRKTTGKNDLFLEKHI